MLIQGPLYPFLMDSDKEGRSIFRLSALGDSISTTGVISEKRVDAWVRTGIHVLGKPDWIIIKTSMHGAVDPDAALGDQMERIFSYLESKYNDSSHYVLHYVTARELYNIVKAIEAGEPSSNPEEYRDFLVRPPIYNSAADCLEASEELKGLLAKTHR